MTSYEQFAIRFLPGNSARNIIAVICRLPFIKFEIFCRVYLVVFVAMLSSILLRTVSVKTIHVNLVDWNVVDLSFGRIKMVALQLS